MASHESTHWGRLHAADSPFPNMQIRVSSGLSDELIGLIYELQDGHLVRDFLGSQRIVLGNNRVLTTGRWKRTISWGGKVFKVSDLLVLLRKEPLHVLTAINWLLN